MAEGKSVRKNRLDAFAERYFKGDKLKIETFKELVLVGQNKSINRELTPKEMQHLAERYVEHLEKDNVTRKDLMRQVLSYRLAQRDLNVKKRQDKNVEDLEHEYFAARGATYSRSKREQLDDEYLAKIGAERKYNHKQGNTLTGFNKMRYALRVAREMDYPVKYKFGMPIELMKGMDVRHKGKGTPKLLRLDNVFAREFAAMYVHDNRQRDLFDLNTEDVLGVQEGRRKLILADYKHNMYYKGQPGSKQKMRKIAAALAVTAALTAGTIGIVNAVETAKENRANYAYSTTMEAAHLAGSPTSAFLSTSRPDVEIRSWEQAPTDGSVDRYAAIRYAKELLKEKGTAGLYDDVVSRLAQYEQTVPSKEEREILYEELSLLPGYVINDKFMPLYDSLKDPDETFYHADRVELKHFVDRETEEYRVNYYDSRFDKVLASAKSRELIPLYESQTSIYASLGSLKSLEDQLVQEGANQYDVYSQMQEQFRLLNDPVVELGRTATQNITAKKGVFIFSDKINIEDRTFEPTEGKIVGSADRDDGR